MREFSERRVYEFENFRLDADSLLLFRDGVQLNLTPKVVATLLAVVERQGDVVTKDDLMQAVWPDTQVEEGNLTQNLYMIRKALGNTRSGEPFIETLRRRGYRFSVEVSRVSDVRREIQAAPVTVEKKANIYSVVDWRKDAVKSEVEPAPTYSTIDPGSRIQTRWLYLLLAVVVTAGVALAALTIFQAPTSSALMNAGGEISLDQLTDGRDVIDATISPNGDYFTYHETDGDTSRIFVQQVGQSTRIEIVPASTRTIRSKTFSPDGKFIYFVAADKDPAKGSLYRIPTLGGMQVKILDDLGSTVGISPDGSQLAFARSKPSQSEIVIANSDGTSQHAIYTSNPTSVIWGGVAWSRDGKSIAFGEVDLRDPNASGRCSISAVDTSGSGVRALSPEKWDGCGRMEFTFDNKALVFTGTKKGDGLTTRREQLYYLSLASGESRRLTQDGNRQDVSSLGVTRAGDILVVPINRSAQLWSMEAGGRSETAKQITRGQTDGRAGVAPLPDGRIGYTARSGDSLGVWIANADGTDARQIINQPGQIEELRSSADGKYFYFSSRIDGYSRLFRSLTDGSDVKRVLEDDSFDVDSTISPDGNWIAYDSAVTDADSVKKSLRLTPTAGGSFVQLAIGDVNNPHFSPDSRFVSYVGSEKLGIIAVPGGESVATFDARQVPILNVGARWTPDGRSLVYIVRQQSMCNLWKQPIDGSPASPLTNFTSGEIYNFAFSSDGKALILSRGYPTRNAMLMKIGK